MFVTIFQAASVVNKTLALLQAPTSAGTGTC